MGSALRGFVLRRRNVWRNVAGWNRCLEKFPHTVTTNTIDRQPDVTFVKTASLNAKDRLPTPKPRKGSKDVKILPPGITKQNSARDKARAPTPAHQLEKKILILEEMDFPETAPQRL